MEKGMQTYLTRMGSKLPDSVSRPKSLPITMSSVFDFEDVEMLDQVYAGDAPGYIYSRNGNPVHDALKEIMSQIDGGEASGVYASGMAAITLSILAHVEAGDHIVAANVLYGGTYSLLKNELKRFNIDVTFVTPTIESITEAVRQNTRLLYVETISNPMMDVVDLDKMVEVCKESGIKLIVDNTFATAVVCRPLTLGADVVVYSATKYICGHSDVTGGIVVTQKREEMEKIEGIAALYGPMMSPFDAWLLVRSLRTLELRVRQHSHNAMQMASYLEKHPKVEKVYYPGLAKSATHEIGKKLFQKELFGGMLSFDLIGGEAAAYQLIRDLENIRLVPSLAGVSTTLSYPAKTSHRALDDQELKQAGISKGTLRLSSGLEDFNDIMAEFEMALNKLP
ncbi:trans-sulfuration enzyme family protein [Anoxynatronum buryatiense]|uniref:homocysteine desulfhydrase n=1 Tax=Anoxynatronum buryatiense TaxID=489973 RepID=A0AA46AIB1_9CLOT|nr:aminotransferase class I/II-fold pyridoxal phosphate-dependent enzyme [Anoxynatronum buryatiense]SMP48186.1 cystathionine gamma-synthase [Anoxynatronum buryatiense]